MPMGLYDAGVTTIAGGRSNRAGHVDGPSEGAKFSSDFDVVYVSSTCSLLVVDRGNQAIREIRLNYDDCAYNNATSYSSGLHHNLHNIHLLTLGSVFLHC